MSTAARHSTTAELEQPDHEVAVVGAGFGGIGIGISLQRKGIHDFIIIDAPRCHRL
ncbi:cation diffusion facilitator CzcD-associated flavoprotein CzcO [Mycobacteroides chelonae]|nr:cation diffusion facilitator CzcD-associated flavoprotein CzcO [Mycobacteroides chelonae]